MLSVDEALAAILDDVEPLPAVTTPLTDALGLILAEDIISDIDSPPFDKSLMDGYAICANDVGDGKATLHVIDEITAGNTSAKTVKPGQAIRIMTGAPIPDGADAVVRVEETTFTETTGDVVVDAPTVVAGANLMRRGTAMRQGEQILSAGRKLRPQELGALAELGRHTLTVQPRPRVAVLATGDELIPVDESPGPGQIRNSNETMLVAQIIRAGGIPVPLGIARDNRQHLAERIQAGLECDMMLLSGGVSAGKLDLVPSELEAAGVRQVFHKVRVKPGKPVWYGSLSATGHSRRHVFGLPGNPVSSMVCFELFARTAIRRLMGSQLAAPTPVPARLTAAHIARNDRPTYYPARITMTDDGLDAMPVSWQGSADLRATVEGNAMILFPPGDREYAAGEQVDVICWDAIEAN